MMMLIGFLFVDRLPPDGKAVGVANILLTQRYAANYTVQLIANTFWMIAAIAHGIALRAIMTGLMLCVNILLLCGGASSSPGLRPTTPQLECPVLLPRRRHCLPWLRRHDRLAHLSHPQGHDGAVGFVFGASGTCINALCSLYYPAAPRDPPPIAAATCLVWRFYVTTVVAERDLDKPDYLPLVI